ncbi:MAG: glycosyltransferase family 2 protein, partial [Lapillicoccus sp.]
MSSDGPSAFEGLGLVVVNYASTPLLAQNLGNVHRGLPGARVVVVDCWSSQREREGVTELARTRGWQLVGLPDNRGFGGGVNAGVEVALLAGVRDVLLLNPDASLTATDVTLLREAV